MTLSFARNWTEGRIQTIGKVTTAKQISEPKRIKLRNNNEMVRDSIEMATKGVERRESPLMREIRPLQMSLLKENAVPKPPKEQTA